MARPATLKPWLLLGLVLVAHLVALEWLARQRDALTLMRELAPPMFTRLLQPAQPPPVVAAPRAAAVPRPPVAVAPRRKASEPLAPEEPVPAQPVQEQVAMVPEEGMSPAPAALAQEAVAAPAAEEAIAAPAAEEPVAQAPQPPASAPAEADALAGWPTDTRLTYRLGGQFRGGPLFGDARVQWQREGETYQVRLDIDIKYFTTYVIISQGEVTPDGLLPRAYEEYRPGKRRAAEFGDTVLALENGKRAPRPAGMQDSASQFVELAHRFASGREQLEVGRQVTFPMARPGAVDLWTYDILGREILQTPTLGPIEAFHLKPRRITNPRGNITAEMWFAPSLQYLPVRVVMRMGEQDYLDLIVEKIEQR